jgi:hypothetical protein
MPEINTSCSQSFFDLAAEVARAVERAGRNR